ncbi:phosphonate ABC transporter, permease protein PhnE [Tritonibacter mobilis]|jgi:phosphonate transport system permease protein|uniref:phosphonate ABC transporter, permease protein PhnE n=1 Tax=Tritonibacter mobilis TaxID=379347 RepID=UPI0001B8AB9F|nr:phosphonate ABC transporter, permease protein PhnE [Tritonibacter mobilis]EEW60916.1 phosphonate ABC transporter, permease protein PhnE [Ruegeria sp. TrichCH4B]NKX39099.1 phosphonate ABC transporter, permease protein PhnE [Rhodobacteraceae bacterium R_SAG5]NKX74641.1 phosphonate ABC transporter, permease protein PhnE [Rhodobacteraceae bacterium R_SAG3]PXW76206.1 phosphonate transport system permease protein [Ruegeria sp. P4]MCA2007892.1 phosphonate ABC transporter, permease protein PhnE [Tr
MSAIKDTWRKPPFISNPLVRYGFYAAVAIYFVVTLATLPIDWARVSDGMTRAQRIFSGAFPPSFERSGLLIDGFLESLKIAILATVGGIAISVPLAFMAASNISIRPIYLLGRGIIIVARSFHPVIVAIIFVKAVGFGPFAGALTLVVYSVGFVAKLLAERIEEIDFGQVEAMRSAGAGFIATLAYAVMPQIMPRLVGLGIYQLDSNLRASAVVGIVGAGGIGATLANAFGRYDYDFALAITMVIVGVILVSEAVSGFIRKRIA